MASAPYPVGSNAKGVLWSDGSIRANQSTPQGYASNIGIPNTVMQSGYQVPQPAPAPTQSSGGSGRYNQSSALAAGLDINDLRRRGLFDENAPQGVSEQEINSLYAPQESYLNQVEQTLRGDVGRSEQEAQGNFDVNKKLLESGKQTNINQVTGEETAGTRRKEDAMQRARRIFQEQGIGSQQRFGGASSAGQAASELLTRNLQSEQGQTQRQFSDFMANIGRVKQEIETKFQDGVLQLQQNLQNAKNQIQRDFQNKLLEINNNRTQLATAKAQMRLQALMDLRNKTFALQQQNQQFLQSLALQKQQDTAGVEQAIAQISGGAQQASQAGGALAQGVSGIGKTPLAFNYNSGGQTSGGNQQYLGYAQSLGSRKEDPLNSVGSIRPSTRDPYSFA